MIFASSIINGEHQMGHQKEHKSHRIGWLRAAVLGANDGIVSTASLIIGVSAANTTQHEILLAGAMSMAAGEYVSVSSQSDTEFADLELEKKSLEEDIEYEKEELAKIYHDRGLEPGLAKQVAEQLMAHDALGAHARDDIGISEIATARPMQAAFSSSGTFTIGAALPLLTAWLVPLAHIIPFVAAFSLVFLAVLGGIAARMGGASIFKGTIRVGFWGALAMGITAAVGSLFGVTV